MFSKNMAEAWTSIKKGLTSAHIDTYFGPYLWCYHYIADPYDINYDQHTHYTQLTNTSINAVPLYISSFPKIIRKKIITKLHYLSNFIHLNIFIKLIEKNSNILLSKIGYSNKVKTVRIKNTNVSYSFVQLIILQKQTQILPNTNVLIEFNVIDSTNNVILNKNKEYFNIIYSKNILYIISVFLLRNIQKIIINNIYINILSKLKYNLLNIQYLILKLYTNFNNLYKNLKYIHIKLYNFIYQIFIFILSIIILYNYTNNISYIATIYNYISYNKPLIFYTINIKYILYYQQKLIYLTNIYLLKLMLIILHHHKHKIQPHLNKDPQYLTYMLNISFNNFFFNFLTFLELLFLKKFLVFFIKKYFFYQILINILKYYILKIIIPFNFYLFHYFLILNSIFHFILIFFITPLYLYKGKDIITQTTYKTNPKTIKIYKINLSFC